MNKINVINKDYFYDLVNNKNNKYYVAVVDGKENQDWNSYRDTIERLFRFPTTQNNYDGYSDWMRDLSWFDVDGFILFILNYDEFLSNDLLTKEIIMNMFRNTILPWWEEDVEKYVVGGEKKYFNIFIVE